MPVNSLLDILLNILIVNFIFFLVLYFFDFIQRRVAKRINTVQRESQAPEENEDHEEYNEPERKTLNNRSIVSNVIDDYSQENNENGIPNLMVHNTIINRFIENYSKSPKTPYIIGVYGGSGSGKTFVTKIIAGTIKRMFPNECASVAILNLDCYYKGGDSETNYDIPDAIDFELFYQHIKMLLRDEQIECPIYDFVSHCRKNETNTIFPAKIIIVEGILLGTQKKIINLCNMKIFISAHGSTQLFRRIRRDINERGRTLDEIQMRYERDVEPSYQQYVLPSSLHADMTINNNGNEYYVGLETVLNHITFVLNKICDKKQL